MAATRGTGAQRGTGFVNWDDFVSANRGAAQRTVGTLAGGVQQAGNMARASLGVAQEDFTRNADAFTLKFDPNRSGSWDEQAQYQYGGPRDLSESQEYQQGMGLARQASQGANALDNAYGRQEMLRQQFGGNNPRYTGGQQRFDSALTGTVGGARFDSLKKDYGGLLGEYGKANSAASQQAGEAARKSKEAAGLYATYANYAPGEGQAKDNRTEAMPEPATPAPPSNPYVDADKRVEDDNAIKRKWGARG